MYVTKNLDNGTITAGGRKSNRGKIVKVRFIGSSPRYRNAVVSRLGKPDKVYSSRVSRHFWNFEIIGC